TTSGEGSSGRHLRPYPARRCPADVRGEAPDWGEEQEGQAMRRLSECGIGRLPGHSKLRATRQTSQCGLCPSVTNPGHLHPAKMILVANIDRFPVYSINPSP